MNAPLPAHLIDTPTQPGWRATLDLRVESREGRSVLARREHFGPLRIQKPLYPEGDAVCQLLLLHPPAGIAGGDELAITLDVAAAAHAQLTTPGAGKWYGSIGPRAHQRICLNVEADGVLEWLPQEAIVFDGALADSRTQITLAANARCMGWDMLCLGRSARGEQFTRGEYRQGIRLQNPDGIPIWREDMCLQGSDASLQSAVALGGNTITGTLWLAGIAPDAALTEALRAIDHTGCSVGITALPRVTLVRACASSAEALRQYFVRAWALARPVITGREAVVPRIWST